MTLEMTWREYLRCCNERRFDELGRYVHDELLFNGEPTTLADTPPQSGQTRMRCPTSAGRCKTC